MLLQITDGTTTVTLSGTSPVLGCTYFPVAPQMRAGEWQPVTETAEVNLRGTHTAIRATINSIESLLQAAALRKATNVGPRVFAVYEPVDSDPATFRSEIAEGRVVWSENPGLRRLGDTNPTVRVAVIWTRAHWWEGAETEVQLSANAQAAATGGRVVYNNPAGGNWVQVAAAQVTGTLPAPVQLRMLNASGSSKTYRRFMVGVNAYSDPANLVHYLQAEARLSGGTITADATSSGGNHLFVTVTASPAAYIWELPAADMARTKGRRFRLLARFAAGVGDLYVTPQVRNTGNVVLWQGDEIALSTLVYESWQDLGVVPLPPGGYSAGFGAMRLSLSLRGSATAALDVLQLTALDSYQHWELPPTGVSIANNVAVVHDGTDQAFYALSGSTRTPLPSTSGGVLTLQPGVTQRLYILHQLYAGATAGAGDAPIAGALTVSAFYRPRRVTV